MPGFGWTSKLLCSMKDSDTRDHIFHDSICNTKFEMSRKDKVVETETRSVVAWGCDEDETRIGIKSKSAWSIILGWWTCSKTDLWWWLHTVMKHKIGWNGGGLEAGKQLGGNNYKIAREGQIQVHKTPGMFFCLWANVYQPLSLF